MKGTWSAMPGFFFRTYEEAEIVLKDGIPLAHIYNPKIRYSFHLGYMISSQGGDRHFSPNADALNLLHRKEVNNNGQRNKDSNETFERG